MSERIADLEKGNVLIHQELGSLQQIADNLWKHTLSEIERNGHSELTLDLEGAARGIWAILDLNNIQEKTTKEVAE